MSLFSTIGGRLRAEDVARAHERLRSLVSSAHGREGFVPDQSNDMEIEAEAPVGPVPRMRITPTAAIGLVVLLVLAVVIAAVLAFRARPHDVGAGLAPPQPPQAGAVASSEPGGRVVVDVAGRVRRPGLVTLPSGSRVADALRAAGGAKPGTDLTSLNLARKVVDGEQIVVGVPGAAAQTSTGAPGASNPVNLNTATASDLDQLPGVGPVLAQRIVDWRTAHGGFTAVSQLRQVTGIGDSKYADLQPLVRV